MQVSDATRRPIEDPQLDGDDRLGIDVCICTYHRPELFDTLEAVATQEGRDKISIRVIVADNAAEPDARASICAAGDRLGLNLIYVHAPARNISIARNACLAATQSDWIAFVDDDEHPSPSWLKELLAEARRGDWDAVLGPVKAVYPATAPYWLEAGDFHSTRPVWVRGHIETGYTGNVLLRRALVQRAGLEFRLEFGRSGGEDLDFFYRLRDRGGRIGFAANALVYDPIPANRTSLAWLLRRKFRQGQSHGTRLLESTHHSLRAIVDLPVALAKAVMLGLAAAACLPKASSRNRCLTRAALHCGVVARIAGLSEITLY
ncbi:MAG TPA: glycosyltransferase family 2 protein [Stellaceae bacterium]|nr:glycosyltransferase family 2 protein [Stellaceae bacterium]